MIRADRAAALRFMVECFEGTCRADEHWMSLFITQEPLGQNSRLHDHTFQTFSLLDSILEGCYKLHLRVIFGFAARDRTGRFPSDIAERDFGKLVSFITDAYSTEARLLIDDPEHHIPINQWRNIAAHKSFAIVSGNTIEVRFGRGTPKWKHITAASLVRVVEWAKRCLATARMANVILYLEYLRELKVIGLPDVPLRLESYLVTLCHNLSIVGFECATYVEEGDAFILSLRDRLGRAATNAIIHASQVLDRLSTALEDDPTTRHRFERTMIRLVDPNGRSVASASIKIEDAIAWTQGKLSMKKRLQRTIFRFADSVRARNDRPS